MNPYSDHHRGHVVAGIAGFGTYTPTARVSAEELARQANIPVERLTQGIGFTHIHKANDDEHPFTMGLAAAKDALHDAGMSGDDVDLVIFVSAGDYDYRFWCPSSAVVRELGCRHAYSFEVRNGCAGGNLACNIAMGLMDRDSSVKTALIICSDTLSRVINPQIPECHPLLYFGDGAAAVVLKRNHPRYQLLSFAEHTDGDLGDLLRVDAGGTRMPIGKDFQDWTKTYSKVDVAAFANLIDKVYLKKYLAVINKALERSGHAVSEIDFVLMNQIKSSLRDHIMEGIGIPQDHTYITMDEFGHIGPADAFFTMAKAHREGLLSEGKLAILASSGLGFSWAASIIRC
ncbi:3-oxoacyl-[acyl-carrier-protein] synthase III C-terminal domain-containing protein [Polynucleobacter sp. MWH-Braz-FAM2G]|uniref:3-oxoacyl-[acyl-carrier-protein] synthase III C-terminal domain-containing protein n=1 Tax=Polynucleobacter sp. MWH-Braz-FAM2G TaxID=1855883 RepID=UPI001BFD3DB6|nr:3-oxoacyl-[acyl-carrier-protein] synthase III C-terminal domain-containing protein [Polynucleobacter sp. MWH-Braz-FAM2G]QWD91582.1 beta-ketoacyl-ACP reductase [Polynucleobacter sp. MWH-Braz-FAM2G]